MSESPIEETVDVTVTSVRVTVTTTRNNKSHIESEEFNISYSTPSPQKMYNSAYLGRNIADRINNELGAPLKDTIARQFDKACEVGHETTGETNEPTI